MGNFGDLIYKNLMGGYTGAGSINKEEVGRTEIMYFGLALLFPPPPPTISLTVLEIIDSMTSAFLIDIFNQEKQCGPFREAGRCTILGGRAGREGQEAQCRFRFLSLKTSGIVSIGFS